MGFSFFKRRDVTLKKTMGSHADPGQITVLQGLPEVLKICDGIIDELEAIAETPGASEKENQARQDFIREHKKQSLFVLVNNFWIERKDGEYIMNWTPKTHFESGKPEENGEPKCTNLNTASLEEIRNMDYSAARDELELQIITQTMHDIVHYYAKRMGVPEDTRKEWESRYIACLDKVACEAILPPPGTKYDHRFHDLNPNNGWVDPDDPALKNCVAGVVRPGLRFYRTDNRDQPEILKARVQKYRDPDLGLSINPVREDSDQQIQR